jgi:hypothetical protein
MLLRSGINNPAQTTPSTYGALFTINDPALMPPLSLTKVTSIRNKCVLSGCVQDLQSVLARILARLPGVRLLVTSRQQGTLRAPKGTCAVEQVGVLSAIDAEELLLKHVPGTRYPRLKDVAAACHFVPLALSLLAGAMKEHRQSSEVSACTRPLVLLWETI